MLQTDIGTVPVLPVRRRDPAGVTGDAVASAVDFSRIAAENLVSFVIVGSRQAEADLAELRSVSAFAAANFLYYELIVIASGIDADWLAHLRQAGAGEANTRIITVAAPMNFEESVAVALHQTIGDYIVIAASGEVGTDDLARLVATVGQGRHDLVKATYRIAAVPLFERSAAWLAKGVIRMATGYKVQKFQARAVALSRNGATRIQASGTMQKFFRILDVSGSVSQALIAVDRSRPRTLFVELSEKLRLTTELVSRSSARLIRALAVICMVLSVTSLAATGFSFLVWMFKSHVAPGWTSLAMISSFLFAANFGVLSSICLGILLLIRRGEPDISEVPVTELSGGDLFLRDARLNVKTGDTEG